MQHDLLLHGGRLNLAAGEFLQVLAEDVELIAVKRARVAVGPPLRQVQHLHGDELVHHFGGALHGRAGVEVVDLVERFVERVALLEGPDAALREIAGDALRVKLAGRHPHRVAALKEARVAHPGRRQQLRRRVCAEVRGLFAPFLVFDEGALLVFNRCLYHG